MDKSSNYSDERLDKLFAAIGNSDVLGVIEWELQKIKSSYSDRRGQLTAGQRRLLRKFRANTARRREQRRQLGPIHKELILAGQLRTNPGVDEHDLRAGVHWSDDDLEGTEVVDYAKIEADEDRDIAFLLDKEGDYRKRDITKLVVEPFLRFLERNNVIPSRALPLNHMMRALFDWLDIEQKLRPTDAGIRTIVSYMKCSRR